MLNKGDVEKRLSDAVERACPPMLDTILERCASAGDVVPFAPPAKKKPARVLRLAALAAAFALVLMGGYWFETGMVAAVLDLDVNPAIELRLNRRSRVVGITPVNDDARAVLREMDLIGADVDVAVNALIGAMLTQGYLTREADSVLISVDAGDAQRGEAILRLATQRAQAALVETLGHGAVLAQNVRGDAALRAVSSEYGFSQGRAALMRALIAENPALTYDSLSALSVSDLALMLSSRSAPPEGLALTGTVSDEGLIGIEQAIDIALAQAGVSRADVLDMETEIDLETGLLVYDVEFTGGDIEYEYKIHTRTGEVLEWELEWRHPVLS